MKTSTIKTGGFTLLEIMLVVLIIGLLIGLAIKNQGVFIGEGQRVAVDGHITNFKTNLLLYQTKAGDFPTTEQGLKALVSKPEIEPIPKQWSPILDRLPLDPWKQEFFYEYPPKHNKGGYDLYSAGPDRKPGTADDIGNWDAPQK